MLKRFFLLFFAQPTAEWLEQIMDNPRMKNDYHDRDVLKILEKVSFSNKDLECLSIDLQHSASHVKYNSKTANGTHYDRKVYKRYRDLSRLVRQFMERKGH